MKALLNSDTYASTTITILDYCSANKVWSVHFPRHYSEAHHKFYQIKAEISNKEMENMNIAASQSGLNILHELIVSKAFDKINKLLSTKKDIFEASILK